jgi:hypothetical protein
VLRIGLGLQSLLPLILVFRVTLHSNTSFALPIEQSTSLSVLGFDSPLSWLTSFNSLWDSYALLGGSRPLALEFLLLSAEPPTLVISPIYRKHFSKLVPSLVFKVLWNQSVLRIRLGLQSLLPLILVFRVTDWIIIVPSRLLLPVVASPFPCPCGSADVDVSGSHCLNCRFLLRGAMVSGLC